MGLWAISSLTMRDIMDMKDLAGDERLSGAWNIWVAFGVGLLLLAVVIALGGSGPWDMAMLESLTGTGSGTGTQVTAGFDAD